jgi:hypothetical protein
MEFLATSDPASATRRNLDAIVGALRGDLARLRGGGGARSG